LAGRGQDDGAGRHDRIPAPPPAAALRPHQPARRWPAFAGSLRLAARAVNSTPESLDVYRIFRDLEQVGGTHATMEVSSHALALGRVYGITFHTAVFTNLTRDHLDFHQTMENYFQAKRLLFEPDGARPPLWAVINNEDPYAREIHP